MLNVMQHTMEIHMPRISVSEMEFNTDSHRKKSLVSAEKWRGPHERMTVGLMLSGIKPAAMTDRDSPDYNVLSRLAENGTITKTKIRDTTANDRPYVAFSFTQNDQVWRANKLAQIYKPIDQGGPMRRIDHVRIGILLGYSNNEIRQFIDDM
jgi:hypothetical protein